MKVCLLSGASSIHTIRWANGLAEAGLEVHIITQHPPIESMDSRVHIHQFPFRGTLGYFTMVPAVKKLLKILKPDLINAHYASGYATTARLVGYHPWLLSIWGSDVYDFPYKSSIHKYLVRSNLLSADRVASTSHCMAEQARSISPSLEKITITPFGVDTQHFATLSTSLEERSDEEPLVIGTVKALAYKYGVNTLIESFAIVRRKLYETQPAMASRLRLRLVGDGPQRKELELQVKRLGLEDITKFVGRVPHDQVPIELEKLDIYVALSRLDSESFGVAIIEAGAAARPVVVSDAGGLPEVVVNNKTGLIVPREDAGAAAEALYQLVNNREMRIEFANNGRIHVETHYDWKHSVESMKLVYKEVVEKNSH